MSKIDWDSLGFDAYRTRTVVKSHFKDGAWSPAESTETFSFTLDPFAQVNHYAISCFEGLKAFTQKDGKVVIRLASDAGLAVYGPRFGRYPLGPAIVAAPDGAKPGVSR